MGEQDRICEVCANTDFAFALDPSRWNLDGPNAKSHSNLARAAVAHQPSLKSLQISALQGCPICLFFMEATKQPLDPPMPFETENFKKEKERARERCDRERKLEEMAGPCLIAAFMVPEIHKDLAPPNGVVAGFRYGPKDVVHSSALISVISSENSPENIATRNLLYRTDIDLCRQWLQQCSVQHRDCPSISETDLPTRLIDVGAPEDGLEPRLIESRGRRGLYVTLSHCWGKSKPPATTKANLSSRMDSIPTASMPKTFRDAVDIVRSLGYRYIWIDSFCIVQDDEADWQHECASMAKVYSDCVVTLASPYASDCHVGFPRGLHPTRATSWCNLSVHWPNTQNTDSIRLEHPAPSNDGRVDWDDSPLAERAWVLQERLLSPRWLYFGNDDLYFECSTAHFDEHLRVPLKLLKSGRKHYRWTPKNAMSSKTYGEGLYNWYNILRTYSHLHLTHASDRLPALAGIATTFAEKFDDEYIAGLWRKDLVFGLLYKVMKREWSSYCFHRSPTSPGPSWSWYTCDSRIQPLRSDINRFTVKSSAGAYDRAQFNSRYCFGPLIEVMSAHATPLGDNSFGEVRNAKLTIMGRLQSVRYSRSSVYSNDNGNVVGEISWDCFGDPCQRESTENFMLPIAICGNWLDGERHDRSWYALGLVKDMIEPDTYFRIGRIQKLSNWRVEADSLERETRDTWWYLNNPPLQKLHLI